MRILMRFYLRWALACLASLLSAAAQETWTQQTSPTAQDLWSVCYGGSTANGFVAVGTAGTVLTSPDGAAWTARTSGTTNWLVGITSGNGLYVAVGDQGVIVTSPDGTNWTVRVSGGGNRLNGVAWSGRQFLAVGEGGAIASSSDGVSWTMGSAGTTHWLHGVAWDFTRQIFWVAGQGGILLTTKGDGTFTPQVSGTTADLEAADVNVYISGIGNQSIIKFAGASGYLAVTSSEPSILALSPYSPVSTAHFQSVGFFGAEFIAVGSNGTIALIYSGETNWHNAASGVTTTLYGVTASSTTAVAVGQSGSILTSPYQQGLPASPIISITGTPALGAPLTLSVSAGGQDPQTYQWSLNGQAIVGATSATLSLASLQSTQTGVYT